MKQKEEKVSKERKKFNEKYNDFSDSEIQKELLFLQKISVDKLKRIDTSTSYLFWFLFIVPILFGVIFLIF